MRSKRLILGFALVALAVGYIELRLPPPVAAQGTDAVFQRLAATTAAKFDGHLAVKGTARFEGLTKIDSFRGQIAAFNGACPTDWDEVTALRGRMIVGLVDGGTLAQSVGDALTDGAVRRGGTGHHHSVSYRGYDSTGVGYVTASSIVVKQAVASAGRHEFVGSSQNSGDQVKTGGTVHLGTAGNQTTPAPYVQFRYCEYQP